ncbi:hypothetical protein [Xanthomonas arboricola]|uniref:hypothetical protein n=1 Tax=Xanthomonas arboricola TaxID=56448 RepID=UPI000AD02963|nr:hypothetical protein [Xanthomonas arboricola]
MKLDGLNVAASRQFYEQRAISPRKSIYRLIRITDREKPDPTVEGKAFDDAMKRHA